MKLRIKGNSIRLRLGRSEVSQLAQVGIIEESTSFDPLGLKRLIYRLVIDDDASEVSASFDNDCLRVSLPSELANSWLTSDRIGIEASQRSSNETTLRILVEKDLECIDAPPEESQADAYPRASHGSTCSSAVEESGREPLMIRTL